MLKIQELFIFFEFERFFSKFQVEIAFFKFASIFSLMYTTLEHCQDQPIKFFDSLN